jgi:N-dimethylarginine dimethylaminohydrolase
MRELLLCPPDYYGIEYEINPWMSVARGAETAIVQEQWKQLHATLSKFCKVHLIAPQPRLPTWSSPPTRADGWPQIHPQQFPPQRTRGEQPFFAKWMEQHGYEVDWLPEKLYFEGEGDALFGNDVLFCGYKFRSDIQSHRAIAEMLVALLSRSSWLIRVFTTLIPAFVLADGGAFWFPPPSMNTATRNPEHVTDLIDVAPEEAMHFSCNAVVIDRDIVLPEGAPSS